MKNEIQRKADIIEVGGTQKIDDGIYTTGELGAHIKEQSLVVLEIAGKLGKIKGVIGGFHGFNRIEILRKDMST